MARRKKQTKALKSWLVSRLRRQHMAWSPKNWAKADARVGRNEYQCADCSGVFPGNEVELDHIEPVIDFDGNLNEDGEFDWHKTVTRMFPQKDGYQVLCAGCHIIKCWLELKLRDNQDIPFEWDYLFQDHPETYLLNQQINSMWETLDGVRQREDEGSIDKVVQREGDRSL